MINKKQARIVQTHIDFDLPSVVFVVEADWQYAGTLRDAGLNYKDWAKGSCLKWLRNRGITRPQLSDLKLRERNDQKAYAAGVWPVSVSLRKGEETMIKMYQGIDND